MSLGKTHSLSGSAAGGMSYVGSATVAGAAATTLSISGLDLDADGQYLIEFSLKNANASDAAISLFYNADTTPTNYDNEAAVAAGVGFSCARANTALAFTLLASSCSVGTVFITKDPDTNPTATVLNKEGTTATLRSAWLVHRWRTTATNVTALILSSSVASALAIGSRIRIWKLNT